MAKWRDQSQLPRRLPPQMPPRPPLGEIDPARPLPAANAPTALPNVEPAVETAEPPVSLRKRDLKAVHALEAQLINELLQVQNGDLVAEIVATAMKLLRDETNRGDIKLIDKSFRELRYALKVFSEYRDHHKVSIFGSARTPLDHPDYTQAEAFGRAMEGAGWMIITGAGSGIMAAGHGGAGAKGSFGLNISLPFEQAANEFIHGDAKLINFKYFFTRKLMFVRSSHAVVLFPGGFGTMDEGFEVLTLIQTGKCPPMPLVMVDHPAGAYWSAWQQYVRGHMLKPGFISPQDESLYKITENVQEAVEECLGFYRNFHSVRYTRDLLIIRLKQLPTAVQLGEISEKFADITLDEKRWRLGGPLKVERDERKLRHLHRLVFPFNRRDHGRLRQLIDHLNRLPAT